MLLTLVGRKNSGKSSVANYLIQKHRFAQLSPEAALQRDTQNGFFLVDGIDPRSTFPEKLIGKGSALWLIRRAGEPDTFKGRKISIVVENISTLEDLKTAVEQKLWGCC